MLTIDKYLSYKIAKYSTIILFSIAAIILIIFSILVRDVSYIRKYPIKFVLEMILVGVLSSIPIFLIAQSRKSSYKRATRDFIVLTVQFILFWVLAELSGINAYLFPIKKQATNSDIAPKP